MNISEHSERDKFMKFLHSADTCDIIGIAISYFFKDARVCEKKPLRIVLRVSTSVARGLRGLAMPPNLVMAPLTCHEVWWQLQTPSAGLRSVTPFTDGAAADTWRGETSASG